MMSKLRSMRQARVTKSKCKVGGGYTQENEKSICKVLEQAVNAAGPRKTEDTVHLSAKQTVNWREAKSEKNKPHEIVLTYVKNKGIHSFTQWILPFQWILTSEPTMGPWQALGIRRIIPALMTLSVSCRETDLLIRKKWQDMMIDEIWEAKETVNPGWHLISAKLMVRPSTEMGNSKGKLSSARGRWWVPSWTFIPWRSTQHQIGIRAGVTHDLYHRLWFRKWRISIGNGHDLFFNHNTCANACNQKWITCSFPIAFT